MGQQILPPRAPFGRSRPWVDDKPITPNKKFTIGDFAMWLFIAFIFAIVISSLGCSSTKPDTCAGCPPKIKLQEVKEEVPCIYIIAQLDSIILPARPKFPGNDATDEEIDKWLADLDANIKKREILLINGFSAQAGQIETHNAQEPKCVDIE